MHYNLLFNGCSFTNGGELWGINADYEYQKKYRFSHLVSEKLEMNYDNISLCGLSNDSIVENTINWFKSGNSCDIAVIQFTRNDRCIWYSDDDTKIKYDFTPTAFFHNQDVVSIKNLYYKFFYSELLGNQNYYKNLFFLTNYFESNNIKYILLKLGKEKNAYNENLFYGWQKYCMNKEITFLSDILGEKTNYNQKIVINENFCQDLRQYHPNNKKYRMLSGTHPSKLGHQRIAECLINKIKKIK